MNIQAAAANLVWTGACARGWRRFRRALRDPARTQRALLTRCLEANRDTQIGRRYDFARLLQSSDVVRAYQDGVPIVSYDDVEPEIARIASGEAGVLTRAPVVRLTPSSGSTSPVKLIPHTADLQREFSDAIDAWIVDLNLKHRSVIGGPAYWSITPARSFERAASRVAGGGAAVPIGFGEDSEYLGGFRQRLVDAVLAVPAEVRHITDPDAFRYVTLLFLIRERGLRLISVWHPSFLLLMLESLPAIFDRLVDDVARGTVTPPSALPPRVHAALAPLVWPDPLRAKELRKLGSAESRVLWPELSVVSCWADGPARPYADRLRRAMRVVHVQAKGLIATEAIVSIPFGSRHPFAIRSHFFELLDAANRPCLVHELEPGAEYTVIVTTGGGLYRYALGDRVRVNGWIGETPSIEFVGRGDRVSDRFGEKLSDGFVTAVLAEIFARGPVPRFAMLAPEAIGDGVAYTLLVEPDGALGVDLARLLERALRRNPHYAWCVDIGQLRPARVVRVGPHADRAYLDVCVSRGQRLGDVKPVSLHDQSGWEQALGGAHSRPVENAAF
jgi:hypothetical protein